LKEILENWGGGRGMTSQVEVSLFLNQDCYEKEKCQSGLNRVAGWLSTTTTTTFSEKLSTTPFETGVTNFETKVLLILEWEPSIFICHFKI
jgi:hypothetical protein